MITTVHVKDWSSIAMPPPSASAGGGEHYDYVVSTIRTYPDHVSLTVEDLTWEDLVRFAEGFSVDVAYGVPDTSGLAAHLLTCLLGPRERLDGQ